MARLAIPATILFLSLAGMAVLLPATTIAATPTGDSYGLETTAGAANLIPPGAATSKQDALNKVIGNIIQTILGFTGVLFMLIIFWAGELWLTADGNEEKLTKARGMIFNSAIGLMVTLAAYLGTNFLVSVILGAIGST